MLFARIAVCCLLLSALSACAAGQRPVDGKAGGVNLEDLAGRTYYLVRMNGQDVAGANAPELSFSADTGRASGRACNRFTGAASIENGTLTLKHIASTRMACFQPFLNEMEQIVFDMLQNGARISLDGQELTLTRGDHTLVYALPSPKG